MPIYFNSDGSQSLYPTSHADAVKIGALKYNCGTVCPTCNRSPYRYTSTHKCTTCALLEAMAFAAYVRGIPEYNRVVYGEDPIAPDESKWPQYRTFLNGRKVRPEPCERGGHIDVRNGRGHCVLCIDERPLTPRKKALRESSDMYVPDEPCAQCGTLSPRHVRTGACQHCHATQRKDRKNSPRQAAIRAGHKTYIPATPCTKCGKCAPRSTNNGQCAGCTGATESYAVIDQDLARMLRLPTFFTGTACERGHVALRRTATGECIMCHSARKAALRAGKSHYVPDTPCKRCGTFSERCVATGKCRGCAVG